MSLCSYLERRGSRYYFRARLPLDVATVIGRSHVVCALSTSDPSRAKILCARLVLSYAGFLARIRLRMLDETKISELSGAEANQLASAMAVLTNKYQRRSQVRQQQYIAAMAQDRHEYLQEFQKLLAEFRFLAADGGANLGLCPPAFPFVGGQVAPAPGFWPPAPTPFCPIEAPLPGIQSQYAHQDAPPPRPASPSWTNLRADFFKDKPGFAVKTRWSYNQALDAFVTVIKGKAIADVRRADLKTFADHLRDRPSGRGDQLSHASISKSLSHIKSFLEWAVRASHLEDDDFHKIKPRDKTDKERMKEDERRAFTYDELERLFMSPLFAQPSQEILVGEAGIHLVLSKLLAWRIPVQMAMPGLAYDLVADVENVGLLRVQVKTTSKLYGRKLQFRMKRGFYYSRRGNFDYGATDFDLAAFVYLPAGKLCFHAAPCRNFSIYPEWLNPVGVEYKTWLLALKHHHELRGMKAPRLLLTDKARAAQPDNSPLSESRFQGQPPVCPASVEGRTMQ